MAKKGEKEGMIWSRILDSLKVLFVEGIKTGFYESLDALHRRIERTARSIMRLVAYYFLMGLSIIFLSIAVIKLLQDYLDMPAGWGYLIIGAIIFISALLMKDAPRYDV